MTSRISPKILDHLAALEGAVDQLQNTFHPDDPRYRADVYRQTMTSLSYSYFAFFHATPEHPDWAPLWNNVFTLQPNPDDVYVQSPVRGDLSYRVSGNRGTVFMLIFTTQRNMSGTVDDSSEVRVCSNFDDRDLVIEPDGTFEVIFSTERPAGYTGNWAYLDPEATAIYLRYRSYDWANERDPDLTIECLDPVPPKPRLQPDEIIARIEEMAKFPARKTRTYLRGQNALLGRVGFNVFEPIRLAALTHQVYWPALFQLDDDEALIIETDMPERCLYWNIQLNDPYFNALEYVYRCSHTNGALATLSTDGRLHAVIALEDPGVPNWLDPCGYNEGGIYGRWYDSDTSPTPVIHRVKLKELRDHLPVDTPVVTPEQRAAELRTRVLASQCRRRW